jgi:hypothetical protein
MTNSFPLNRLAQEVMLLAYVQEVLDLNLRLGFFVFLGLSKQMLRECLETGHILSNSSFVNRSVIRCSVWVC